MAQRTLAWDLPTTYTDGSAIADQSKIVTHIYADGVEVAVSRPGENSWVGELALVPGNTYSFTAKCEMDGIADDLSLPSPEVLFTVPFQVANPPTGLSIM